MDVMHRDPPAAFLFARPPVRGVRNTWRVPEDGVEIVDALEQWTFDPPCGN
jgi:hypothetical protein